MQPGSNLGSRRLEYPVCGEQARVLAMPAHDGATGATRSVLFTWLFVCGLAAAVDGIARWRCEGVCAS